MTTKRQTREAAPATKPTKERTKNATRPWIFKGDGSSCVVGVPMRDLTEAEHATAIETGRIVDGDPTGEMYTIEAAPKAAASEGGD